MTGLDDFTDVSIEGRLTDLDHYRGQPIVPVTLDLETRQAVIEDCRICGETHRHSALDPALLKGRPSHRVGHCHVPGWDGDYYLRLAEGVDVPESLQRWADRQRIEASGGTA